jgi:predicted phage terminase large subunit-like protein
MFFSFRRRRKKLGGQSLGFLNYLLSIIMVKLKWSKYIPHDPTVKQLEALKNDSKELLFGGALGGGKSDYLLMCALQYADLPGYASAVFRKSLTDLKLPGALLDRARDWLQPFMKTRRNPSGDVTYVPGEHTYYFKTRNPDGSLGIPARLCFCYIGEANIKDRYQSAEFQTVCFDEISQWETAGDYKFMTTRLRKNVCRIHGKNKDGSANYVEGCDECDLKKASPTRLRAATNPGGLGGLWIKKRWQILPDPELYPDKREALKAIREGVRVPFVGTHPNRVFVPSYIDDNPFLDQVQYREFLDELDPHLRSQLRDGNWEARADSRYKREHARYYRIYDNAVEIGSVMHPFTYFEKLFITVDPAGTIKEGVIDQEVGGSNSESHTVISVWGVTADRNLFWLDMVRFRDEIPQVVDQIARVYGKYHPRYVLIEQNGVGLGVAQYVAKLGIPVKKIHKGRDKLENSTAAQLMMRAGKIWLPDNAKWIDECEDELFAWTGLPSEQDDVIDTLSDAANDIGPLTDVLEEDVAKDIKQSISIPTRSLIQNIGLSMNTPTARRLQNPFFREKQPDIKREWF